MLKNGALGILALVIILWAANISYGFVHEASHALIVKTLGGQVYELYVNPLGTDAYTTHSYIEGPAGTLALELAGLHPRTGVHLRTLTALDARSGDGVFTSVRTICK